MKVSILEQINAAKATRSSIAVVTTLLDGQQRLISSDETNRDSVSTEVDKRLLSGKSGIVEIEGKELFIQVHVPPPRLIIIGAVHISQALVPMAQTCDFDVTVIDPRTAFASVDRFPNVPLHAEWPLEILGDLQLDPFTALVAVTHDPKIDDIPLQQALEAKCFYVGALGSRKTHDKRRERLLAAGVPEHQFDTIHAPIGLNIGAANPAEIAVAIMAQVIEALRMGPSV